MKPEKPKVLVTRHLPQIALDKLTEHFEMQINPLDKPMEKQEIIEKIKDKDALLCLLTDTIDGAILEAAQHLKIISNYAVGFNNIDVKEATRRKIPVCITPGILTEATADLTWALILAVTRRIVEADQYTREGKFEGWAPNLFLGSDLSGKTLGIIGMGRIGEAVFKRTKGFGMKVVYNSHSPKNITDAEFVSLPELLKISDIISLHTPLTPETHHLINEQAINSMKPTAYLINTTRGAVIDEQALVKALKENKIKGAGLDVYEQEPLLTPELKNLKNVVILPHIGSATEETRTKMAIMAVENIIALWTHKKPHAIANPEVLN